MGESRFRFYAELNDHLPADRRGLEFVYGFQGQPTVKDAVEAIGVPHPEIDLVVVDGVSVGFGRRLHGGERVAVYPVFEAVDISSVVHLRPAPLRDTRFILDGHLGRLARTLRLLGFDTVYERSLSDPEIVRISLDQRRVILTRDRQLLKSKRVTHGYWVRATDPDAQAREVVRRFDLVARIRPFTRCLVCNGGLVGADPVHVAAEAPERVRARANAFHRCVECGKLYWPGTHYERLRERVRALAGPDR